MSSLSRRMIMSTLSRHLRYHHGRRTQRWCHASSKSNRHGNRMLSSSLNSSSDRHGQKSCEKKSSVFDISAETRSNDENGSIVRTENDILMKRFIESNCAISSDHLTPEIALRLMTTSSPLWDAPVDQSISLLENHGIGDPFWAFYWPGGQVLTRYLLDNPSVVHGKDILDVGSGCGASAIAAAMGGAKSVLANDTDTAAIQAIKLNAALNHVTIATTSKNLIGGSDNQWDVVLLGDMFYDRDFTNIVTDWLSYLADHETEVLIGDPGRLFLQEHPIRELLVEVFQVELSQQCKEENNGMTHGAVWKLTKPRK